MMNNMDRDTTDLVTYIEDYLYEKVDFSNFVKQSIEDEDEVFKYLFPNWKELFDEWGEDIVMQEFYEPYQQWENNMYASLKN